MYDFDLKKIEQYLTLPKDIPEYRQGRSHLDFIANIPSSANKIKGAFKQVFKVAAQENYLNEKEQDCLKLFLDTKKINVIQAGVQ